MNWIIYIKINQRKHNFYKMNMQTIQNATDLVSLYQPLNLYLKPLANLTIIITLPNVSASNKSVSNFDVMDKLRQMILPDTFSLLKVSRSM